MSSRSVCPTTGLQIQPEGRSERRVDRRTNTRTSAARAASDGDLVGRIVDERYRVLSVIGQGGMGTVFEAEHLNIGRKVALKILKPEHAQKKDAIERLKHEARVVSQIGHPNICEIFDIGQLDNGSPYLVMERLRGETLAERLERAGPVPFQEMLDILVQVLAGLEAAHKKNVIHRDMKPDNVFLAERVAGKVAKILDFGISKATVPEEQPHHLTRTGMVMGTPYYMAPEQAMGERSLDGRVDIWGVGVLLYEALTGTRPFVARNYNALLVQILTVPLRPIRELRAELSPQFAAVVSKSLEKRREARFMTAREFSEAISPFRPARIAAPPRKARQATYPKEGSIATVPVFNADESSSFTSSDDEPTQEIEAKARKTFLSEDSMAGMAESSGEEPTPPAEENDATIVDPPRTFEHDLAVERGLHPRGRRR